MADTEVISIHRAIKGGNIDEVIRSIADDHTRLRVWTPFGTWLQNAATYGNLDIVRWLASKGLDVNTYNASNPSPPLCNAVARGHAEVAKFLVMRGAPLDVSTSKIDPLLVATIGRRSEAHTAAARVLVDAGIDTTVRCSSHKNMNAREIAAYRERNDIVKLLQSIVQ